MKELGLNQDEINVYCNNQSVIYLIKNHAYHERSKHIDVKLHFIRDIIASSNIHVKKINSKANPTYALAKCLPPSKFNDV